MCKYCVSCDFTTVGFNAPFNKIANIYLCSGNSKAPEEDRFRFCPMCGKRINYEEITSNGRK